jgi:hypothetical protein
VVSPAASTGAGESDGVGIGDPFPVVKIGSVKDSSHALFYHQPPYAATAGTFNFGWHSARFWAAQNAIHTRASGSVRAHRIESDIKPQAKQ